MKCYNSEDNLLHYGVDCTKVFRNNVMCITVCSLWDLENDGGSLERELFILMIKRELRLG